MKPQYKKLKIKSIITMTIAIILLLLIILAEDIIKLHNKNKMGLSENTAQTGYSITIGDKTYDITNAVAENANSPTISAGMIPVKWDGSYWVITKTDDTSWYDYPSVKPAYMMLNDGTYQSELVRDMEGKKLAEKNIGAQVQETELGTIYMWLPRYAYNEQGEILYIKQGCSVAVNWKIPEIFTHETEKIDLSLAGIWVEYKPLASSEEVTTKVNNMIGEENKYGFIANTVGVGVPDDPNAQETIQKYIVGVDAYIDPLIDVTNLNRTILKITNTNQTEPIKAKVEYNKETEKVEVELIYFKYGIKQVVTEKGKELIKTSINTYELENLDDVTYTYKIIDTENNIKEIRINDIYIIPNVETLNKFRDEVNAGNSFSGITVIQTANIDMSKVCSKELGSWTPIGVSGTYFSGTYNGNYNQINNLYINTGTYENVGLFSQTETSTIIQNLLIENPYIYNSYSQSRSRTGAIVGWNYGEISNCASIGGKIIGYQATTSTIWRITLVGGVAGNSYKGTVLNCFNTSTINGIENTSNSNGEVRVGGVIGYASGGIVSNCYNRGNVNGKGYNVIVGGVMGAIAGTSSFLGTKVTNCYNCGTVSIESGTNKKIGGVTGINGLGSNDYPAGTITNCYCITGTTYSYYYYSSGFKTSTAGRVDSEELKGYATTLGDAYKDDTYGINNDYPILTWQEGWLKKQKILAKAYYDTTEEKIKVEIAYSGNEIKQVVTEKGKELTKIGSNTYELDNLDDVTYTYKIIDNQNNIKEVRINDIYIIPEVETLNKFRDEVNAGNNFSGITVIQTANIDMSSVCSKELGSWTPIGATNNYFEGTYNGNYNTISNLYINTGEYNDIGLLSQVTTNTTVQNVVIENPYIYNSYSTNSSYAGAITGRNYGKISNCASIGGTITGYQTTTATEYKATMVGGLVGYNRIGTVLNCFNTSTISGTANTSNSNCQVRVGGINGINNGGIVSNCYNGGNVTGKGYYAWVGGVIGRTYKDNVSTYPAVTNCYNYGTVSIISGTNKYIGGIVAANGASSTVPAGTITNSYCTTGTTYSYYYYSSGFKTSTEGRVDSEELKGYVTTLGEAYKEDIYGINNGYPILTWQEGWLKKQKILAKAYYDETEEKIKVEIIYSGNEIKQVVNEKGKELTKIGNNTYELENLDDVTYTYKIIDNENNVKEIKIDDIYIIPDVETLSSFRDEVNAGNDFSEIAVIQTANIDMSSVCSEKLGSWVPIGVTGTYFAGTYNGNYNQINNLHINTGLYANIGLFSQTEASTIIQNLIIENPYVYNSYSTNSSLTGAFVGYSYGKIINCASIKGTITGYQTTTSSSWKQTVVGGIVGYNRIGTVLNCFNTSTISGTANTSNGNGDMRMGGIIGINNGGTISNCYNGGSTIGKGYTVYGGGVIGRTYKDNVSTYPTVTNCYNYGTVSITSGTNKYIGGIAAMNGGPDASAGAITNCYCTTEATYSYYYYSSGFKTSTEGRVDSGVLKGYATTLGDAFVEDTAGINNGYPILAWQTKISK